MIKGIEHIAIVCSDSASLMDWYRNMFEFRLVYDNGKGAYFLMAPDGSMLEFLPAAETENTPELKTGGIRHLALTTTDEDFDRMVAKLKEVNIPVLSEAVVAASGIKTFFFRDPEGNILHLIYRPLPLGT